MANEQTVVAVTNAVAVVLPSVIALIKALTAKANPGLPVPTDAEVLALFASTCLKSIAVDDAWLSAHPG
jgi:hypothetical protein